MAHSFRIIKGQSLIELMLAIALTGVMLPAIITGLIASRDGKAQQTQRIEATALLQEAGESLRSIRALGWGSFAVDGTFHPQATGSAWLLVSGSETINGFTRSVLISDVFRDPQGRIATSGGTLDPSTKKVDITVTWSSLLPSVITSTMYFTRYLDNISFTQTTKADFDAGTQSYTAVTNTSGGEVQLGSGGAADWCIPQDSLITTLTLPKQGNAIQAVPGSAYVGMGDGSQGTTFLTVGITNPPWPATPSASIAGSYDSSYKTNGVFSNGSYAYLAADGGTSQVVILDISHMPYTKIGWIDVPGGLPANGVYVVGNIAYVTSGRKIYSFDVTTKTGAHSTALASASIWIGIYNPLAKQIIVVGNYAFVGTANTLFGLQKFRIGAGGSSFKLVGVSNLTWQQSSQGLAVSSDGRRAYVAFNQGSFFAKGFFIVDTSPADAPDWWILPNFYNVPGSYNVGTMDPRGMVVVPGNRAIVVGIGGTEQYQVVNITNEGNPVHCGGLAIASGVGGVSSVLEADGDAFSYIVTGEARDQFKVIQGGIGAGQFASSGYFESSVFDPGYSTAFNYLNATVAQPDSTDIWLQLAVAPPVSGSCNGAAYTYVGPDGSPATHFDPVGASISAAIPFGVFGGFQNPARCFRYKATLSTNNQHATPILYDVTVNYSP